MRRLVIPENLFHDLSVSGDPTVEHLAFGHGGISTYDDWTEFLIRDVRTLDDEEYEVRTAGLVRGSHDLTWEMWKKGGMGYEIFLAAHSHTGPVFFSATDDAHDHRVFRNVHHFCPVYIRLVSGTDGFVCESISREDQVWKPVDEIKVLGSSGVRLITPKNAEAKSFPEIDANLHDRTCRLGEGAVEALQRIHGSTFGVIGGGGGNSLVLFLMKFFTPKKIIIVEPDTIERHNANRFAGYHEGDEGKRKVEILEREIHAFCPDIEVVCVPEYFPGEDSVKALKAADALFSFPDNDATRYDIAIFAARYLKTVLDAGTLVSFLGKKTPQRITARILSQFPGGPCLHCLGVVGGYDPRIQEQVQKSQASYSDDPSLAPAPQVVTTNSFAATLLVRNVLSWFYPGLIDSVPTYLQFEELVPSIQNLTGLFPRDPDCPICGDAFEAERGWGDSPPTRFETP